VGGVSKTVAIMQPTFLPWIGYFAMIDRVEEFVFLDSVQFARRSWQQRNKVKTPNGSQWITVSVSSKGLRDQKICDARIDSEKESLAKIEKTLVGNYSRAPFFNQYSENLFEIFRAKPERLADLNISLIRWAVDALGIKTPLKRSSEMELSGAKADLLALICEQLDADRYLSAPASKDYLDDSTALKDAGVALEYHEYKHPSSEQAFGAFAPYMCIADLLFNAGPKSLEIIRSGVVAASGKGDLR
jgi:hypothetical protein